MVSIKAIRTRSTLNFTSKRIDFCPLQFSLKNSNFYSTIFRTREPLYPTAYYFILLYMTTTFYIYYPIII
jgi:hypothetical protein